MPMKTALIRRERSRRLALGLAVASIATVIAAARPSASEVHHSASAAAVERITLTDDQLRQVKVAPAAARTFETTLHAVGYVDFDQDRTVQVASPWAGRIRAVYVKTGDPVRAGAALYAIDSPDLAQAESTLIAAAGVLELSTRALERARRMVQTEAAAKKDLDQAVSDQQGADAAYAAARRAVQLFGKSDAQIDAIVAQRRIDSELRIASPLAGVVTARSAQAGALTQPGNSPAPVTVADVSRLWAIANATEYDLPLLRIGQDVSIRFPAFAERAFRGRIDQIAAAVDPATHRIAVRCTLADPKRELRPQMLATFTIHTGRTRRSVALPAGGIVREGNGTMTVFVTSDGRTFERRAVRLGIEQDGLTEILDGVSAGEQTATAGALFLSNALALQNR